MVKGVAVKLKSYEETIPKVLKLIKFDEELKKHDKVVLKPNLINGVKEDSTSPEFVDQVLKFCMENKNPGTQILMVEGCNGHDTLEVFNSLGYTKLAEKYGIGFIDLNNTETTEVTHQNFLSFETIMYPEVLLDSFIISLPKLNNNEEDGFSASLHNMLGAFPAKHYKGFLSSKKNKLNKYRIENQIHDIIQCKMPGFAIIDASQHKMLIAGQPMEMDKQAAKALNLDWQTIAHLKLIDESLSGEREKKQEPELENKG